MLMNDLMPMLNSDCRLYFDGKHDRWVLKAPQQMMFPDHLTLIMLQACDGSCSGLQIARSLASFPELKNVSEADVLSLLDEYQRRGFLACQELS